MVGLDRIAEMANRLGTGVDLGLNLPSASPGLVPTLNWAHARGIGWAQGNTVVQAIGQGYTQVTPIALATMIARVASGLTIGPHVTRRIGGDL